MPIFEGGILEKIRTKGVIGAAQDVIENIRTTGLIPTVRTRIEEITEKVRERVETPTRLTKESSGSTTTTVVRKKKGF